MKSLRVVVAVAVLGSPILVTTFAREAPSTPLPSRQPTSMLPLHKVVERALVAYPGRLMEAERDREQGRSVYELEIVDEDGRMLELHYDAFTGELLEAQEEHDTVYEMRRSGRILPLSDILERARRAHPGELLEADLEDKRGRNIYELEMAGDDGLLRELYFDAESGELLRTELDN